MVTDADLEKELQATRDAAKRRPFGVPLRGDGADGYRLG